MSASSSPHGPGAGGHAPSPEQIALLKEAGIRKQFTSNPGYAIGPYVMGYVINLVMLGILISQVWHWAAWTKREKPFIRIIVYWVSFFSLASSVLCMTWFYHILVARYGTFSPFIDSNWFSWLPILDECVIIACQGFNLDRAYRLNGQNKWILIAIVPFIIGDCGCVVARQVVTYTHPHANIPSLIRPYTYIHFYTMIVIDSSLTIAIGIGLRKSKTGWSHTDALIKRIMNYTIQTQLLPTLAAITMSIQFTADRFTTMAFLYIICQGKIPAVMLMAVLNYRFVLQRETKSSNFMSTEALVHHPEQESKNDIASQTQSFAMGNYPPSLNDMPVVRISK